MVVVSGKSLLIQLLLVVLFASLSKLSHGKGSDPVLSTSGRPFFDIEIPELVPGIPNEFFLNMPFISASPSLPPPPPSPPPPSSPPPPRQSPPPPKQSPPPPSTDSFFIPPFVIPPIDIPPLIPPLLPVIPSIINPTPSSQLSPPLLKSPPSPSQCKPSPPDKILKLTPPPPAKQPPVKAPPPAKQPPPPPTQAPSPSPARQPTPPQVKAPSPSPARQPTPPPVKAPSPSPARQPTPPPPPPSKKSPPPAPPPSIANPPVMAPSPSPAPHPPVIIAPFPSSPDAKPPVIPRRPVKPILPPSLPAVKTLTVNGVVYCKPCNSYGAPNLLNATPLQGASARLVCYNGKNAIVQSAITDKNGEFRLTPKSLIGADIGKCKVYLVKSPNPTCNVPTNFNGGKTGTLLQHVVPPKPPIVTPAVIVPVQPPMSDLYGVGPFIFEASSKVPCAMHRKL
ncbi:hypothetical protein AABB24_003580 [Solanum stoloniferum]|uniref:Uncharacterized protein n=1 Tax=Solanum stoloniferum TaxID=62892 RepID=A0ABD2V7Y0_9SOLN